MGMFDNVYIQIVLVVLAFYIVTQVIQKPNMSEHIDDASLAAAGVVPTLPVPSTTGEAAAPNASPAGTTPAATPQPLSALAEPVLARALVEDDSALGVAPMDYDKLFDNQDSLDPSELIPKTVPSDIFGDIKPNPALDQNFMQNPFHLGIQTQAPKRNYVHDIRGAYPNPITTPTPFLQGTIMPDFHRKVLEISEPLAA